MTNQSSSCTWDRARIRSVRCPRRTRQTCRPPRPSPWPTPRHSRGDASIPHTVRPPVTKVGDGRTAIDTIHRVVARQTHFASWITILAIFHTHHEVIRHVAITCAKDVSSLETLLRCQVKHAVGANRRRILVFLLRATSTHPIRTRTYWPTDS